MRGNSKITTPAAPETRIRTQRCIDNGSLQEAFTQLNWTAERSPWFHCFLSRRHTHIHTPTVHVPPISFNDAHTVVTHTMPCHSDSFPLCYITFWIQFSPLSSSFCFHASCCCPCCLESRRQQRGLWDMYNVECLKYGSNGKSVSVGVRGGGDGVVAIMEAESAHTHITFWYNLRRQCAW